jgi:retron-type reverse transcriptase
MKVNNIYDTIVSMDNLYLADANAQRGKSMLKCVVAHNQNKEKELADLHDILCLGKFKNSQYTTFEIFEPKKRTIARLPFYPDRIVHHAVVNKMEKTWNEMLIKHTFCCIKGRGIKGCVDYVKSIVNNRELTRYCLKIDIHHYYQSINHDILKRKLRKNISDDRLLQLLDEVIDSYTDGVPIGNYLSQFFANIYLCDFDKWVTKTMNCRRYARYADDMVFFASDKETLRILLMRIKEYLNTLKLTLKGNEQIFPVADNKYDKHGRGVDFCGVVFYHCQTCMRKTIKKKFARKAKQMSNGTDENQYKRALSSWYGWARMCNSKHLLQKIVNPKFYKI